MAYLFYTASAKAKAQKACASFIIACIFKKKVEEASNCHKA